MKHRDIILLSTAALFITLEAQFVPPVPKPGETCVNYQSCNRTLSTFPYYRPMILTTCRLDG